MHRLSVVAIVCLTSLFLGADWYASPSVVRFGKGSRQSPWNLTTALAYRSTIKPGDTLYLLGGTYRGTFKPTLQGTPDKPITICSAPGEWAVIDGSLAGQATKNVTTLDIAAGGWLVVRNLEITNSDPQRKIADTGSNPPTRRGGGVGVRAPGVVLDGLVIHDCGDGIGVWLAAASGTVRNCVVYNNGWTAADRPHGHGIYTQSADERVFEGNVVGPQFGYTLHAYGSDQAQLDHFRFRGNVFAGSVLIGGSCPVNDLVLEGNVFQLGATIGYGDWITSRGVLIHGNHFLGRLSIKYLADDSAAIEANRFYGLPEDVSLGMQPPKDGQFRYAIDRNTYWKGNNGTLWWRPGVVYQWPDWQAAGYDRHGVYFDRAADNSVDTAVVLGRAVSVLNFSNQSAVAADLSAMLTPGDRYRVRHALNWHVAAAEGVYDGKPVSLPMGAAESVAVPVGWHEPLMKPDPRFGCFLVERLP